MRLRSPKTLGLSLRSTGAALIVALAACSGAVSTTPVAQPTSSHFSTTTVTTLNPTGTMSVPLSGGGYTGTFVLNNGVSTAGLTDTVTLQDTEPASLPALQSVARASTQRSTLGLTAAATLLYIQMDFSAAVSASGGSLTIAVPTQFLLPAGVYDIALYNPATTAGWQEPWAGPASISGNTLTFTLPNTIAFSAGVTYDFALYQAAASSPSPAPSLSPSASVSASPSPVPSASASPSVSPSPSSSPTESPSPTALPSPTAGPVMLSTSSLVFTGVGSGSAQTVSATQTFASGTFSATTPAGGQTNSCAGIATISPVSGNSFTVTPVAAGACAFTITGDGGKTATLSVGITTTTVGGS